MGGFFPTPGRRFFGPAGGTAPNVQVFTAGGTWTKPAGNIQSITFRVWGGGGGGPAGACQQNLSGGPSNSPGAVGAGAAGYIRATYRPSDVAATAAIVVGAKGTKGIGLTNNGSQVLGTNGGDSTVNFTGVTLTAHGGNTNQLGGTAVVAGTPPISSVAINGANGGGAGVGPSGNGANGTSNTSGGEIGAASGGGGGAVIITTDTSGNGGASTNGTGGNGQTASNATGTNGGPSAGGGAAESTIGAGGTVQGGNGGNGANPGDGGGGGGGAGFKFLTGGTQTPSNGGDGGVGQVIVTTTFF